MVEELELPLDAAGFSRRECPRCRASFKVRWGRREAAALGAAFAERVGQPELADGAARVPPRHCPYCAFQAEPAAWWTAEQQQWLEARARELRDEIRWRRLRRPYETLADNPRPTYVPVSPTEEPTAPIHEGADDLVASPMPCCGEELRVSDGWVGPLRCHYCGFVHARDLTRDIGLELAMLREWVA